MQGVTASLAGRAATQQFEVEAASSGQQGEILQLHHQVAGRVRQTLMRWYSRGGGSPIRSALHIGPVGLENSKLKTARLDLRMYRTCD